MSDAIPADILRDLAQSDRKAYLEQRLFVFSPFGTFVTAALAWLLLAASFAAVAAVNHLPFLITKGGVTIVEPRWRNALTTALLIATVLGLQRFARTRERGDFTAFANVLGGGEKRAAELGGLTPAGINLTRPTIIGFLAGALIVTFFDAGNPSTPTLNSPAFYVWFGTTTILLCMMFARGVVLTRQSGRLTRAMIDGDLQIDLLRIDRLSVVGRSAARSALVWFAVSAVTCLFFIGGGMDDFTIGLLLACAAMGVWIFVATMERVHRKIRAAKTKEIERLRGEIDVLRPRAAADAGAAQCLQGLLAYETRIAAAPEWPFDQTTLLRVVASAFILTVPWFGQALAGYVVEQLGHIGH
jgi:hypothetical protein